MRTRLVLVAIGSAVLSVVAAARDASACGGCFQSTVETQSGDVITDHRMIFRVTPQATTLYDEIEYQGNPQSFAWVLPIHGTVEVGLSSDVLFASLDAATTTTIQSPPRPQCPSCACSTSNAPGASSSSGGGAFGGSQDAGVTVLGQQTVGPYETVQLQSTDPNALETWLANNGYALPADVQPIVAAYVQDGFDFLAMKLVPGQGISAMRPVRVTSPGASLSLPLRMVAAGTGATVGITLWVVGDGRYEPQNFKGFTISPSELVWNWSTQDSNYTTVRAAKEAALSNAAWQTESALTISAYQVEDAVLRGDASLDYLPIAATDAGGEAGAGETAEQVRQDDLAALFPPGEQSQVWITRIRSDLAHAALKDDLVLQASQNQSTLSNVYPVTQSINAPTCAPVSCPPCDSGSSSGSLGGFGIQPTAGAGRGSGCSAGTQDPGSTGADVIAAAFVVAAIAIQRGRRRRVS